MNYGREIHQVEAKGWDQATSCSKKILAVSKLEPVGEYIFILAKKRRISSS